VTEAEKAEIRQLLSVYKFPLSLNWISENEDSELEILDSLADPQTTDEGREEQDQRIEVEVIARVILDRLPEHERLALQAEFLMGWFDRFENKRQATETAKYHRIGLRMNEWIRSGQGGRAWAGVKVSKLQAEEWYEAGLVNARELMGR
jgi:DNA-directed RNA polymerase specialized sigma subunit